MKTLSIDPSKLLGYRVLAAEARENGTPVEATPVVLGGKVGSKGGEKTTLKMGMKPGVKFGMKEGRKPGM